MAGLIGENPAVIGPGPAPSVLIVIGLIAAPSHADGPQDEPTEAARVQRLARLDDWQIESILLDDKKLDARRIAGAHHIVGVLQPKGHGFFDNNMLARLRTGDRVRRMQSAR